VTMANDAQFEVDLSDHPGVPVLRVTGEVDVATAPEFHARLADLTGQSSEILVVDLSGVTFIYSTGLGVLVAAEKQMRTAGKGLRLIVTQPHITRVLELTGLDEIFTVLPSTKDVAEL
jgi:anti-sigma B factor antagonist